MIADVTEVLTCMRDASGEISLTTGQPQSSSGLSPRSTACIRLQVDSSKGSLPVGSSATNSTGTVTSKQGRRGYVTTTGGPLKKKRKVR